MFTLLIFFVFEVYCHYFLLFFVVILRSERF